MHDMDDRPVRLTLVDLSRGIGLAERSLWELATRLNRGRYEVHAWLSGSPALDDLAEALCSREILVERFEAETARWDWRTPFGQWLQLRRERPRLVHVHHAPGSGSLRVARLASADGIPVVVSCHASVPETVTDAGARRVYENADLMTAATSADADQLVHGWGIDRGRVRVIPYGADLPDEDFERPEALAWRSRLGARPVRPLWVCPLRLEPHRGLEVLLDALAELRQRGIAFVAVFSGSGPERGALEQRAGSLGLSADVRFLERVEPVGSLLAAADLAMFPALEGPVPLTLLDTMARGRPVVATSVPGVRGLIRDGIDGRLVPPGDAAALAHVLEELHRRPDAAGRLGAEAAWRAREEFSWARVVEQFEDSYDEVLGLASFSVAGGSPRRRSNG
jgi:glycosyltransferase involved in cell wall biosynthesis